jgi:hypothetical protein
MGHLAIVNQKTIKYVISEGCISTTGTLGKNMIKTVSDIFADALATRPGDFVFPWIISDKSNKKDKSNKNIGFKYIFRVKGPPVLVNGDPYPVKVPLQDVGYEFEIPLSEPEALDLWTNKLLWNAIGKKSLGRGRSLTHQLPMEDERLLELLKAKNSNNPKQIKLGENQEQIQGVVPISINPQQGSWNPSTLQQDIQNKEPKERISYLKLDGLPWRNGHLFHFEKTLEAWIMENIGKSSGKDLDDKVLVNGLPLEWFGNYLPFGVAGGNIDVVILQSNGTGKICTVIELKVASLNQKEYLKAANQVINYAHFIQRAFNSYNIEAEMNPVVLCGRTSRAIGYLPFKSNGIKVELITYSIDNNGQVDFLRLI